MTITRALAVSLAGLAVAGGVAACGDDDDEPQGLQPTTATITPTTPAGTQTAPSDAVGRVSLGLDALLRGSSEFAVAAQKCVRGDKAKAESCAQDAFEDLEKARDDYAKRVDEAKKDASSACKTALDRSVKSADGIVGVLQDLRDAAGTGQEAKFTDAGKKITTTLQRESPGLVAPQAACVS